MIKLLKIIGCKPTELSIYKGRLKSKKAAYTTCFPCRTLNSSRYPVPSPRGRELERGQQAARLVFWAVRVLGKVAEIWRMPSPQPSPTGEGAGCGGFKRYRSSEKRTPETSTARIFQVAFIARQVEQTPRDFFRRPLNPSVGCVPQGTHAVGWDCRENGERVRAYRTHSICGLRFTCCIIE